MQTDKALLPMGDSSFLVHLMEEFSSDGEIGLSVGIGRTYAEAEESGIPFRYIRDRFPDRGPLGGLQAVFSELNPEPVFLTTVDLPHADRELKRELEEYFSEGIDAVVPMESDGRMHPLCGIYRTSLLPILDMQLQEGDNRVRHFLQKIRVCYVPVHKLNGAEKKLANINTPEDYDELLKQIVRPAGSQITRSTDPPADSPARHDSESLMSHNRAGIPILAAAAYSGTGKTRFLERLIAELKSRGVRTAVLKHDVHGFAVDQEGKDTRRFAEAGADPVLICSDAGAARMEYHAVPVKMLLDGIEDVDLILIEGFKHGHFPKILLYREAAGKPPAFDPEKEEPVMIVSDRTDWGEIHCPVVGTEEIERAADIICRERLRKEGR